MKMKRPHRFAERAGGSHGFTLVEVLIGLVVAGLLGAAVISLLLEQSAFYGEHDEVVFAEQSLRATADLVASEMRVAGSKDVISAGETALSIRFDVLRGVVCGESAGQVDMYVFERADNANLGGDRGTAISGSFSATFDYHDDFDGTGTPDLFAAINCPNVGAPPVNSPADSVNYRRADWSAMGTTPQKGDIVRVYQTLTYEFAPSSFGSGTALWRNDQELVGPFADDASFEYRVCTGGCTWKSPVPPSEVFEVEKVRIVATAIGEGGNRYNVARDLNHKITLRN